MLMVYICRCAVYVCVYYEYLMLVVKCKRTASIAEFSLLQDICRVGCKGSMDGGHCLLLSLVHWSCQWSGCERPQSLSAMSHVVCRHLCTSEVFCTTEAELMLRGHLHALSLCKKGCALNVEVLIVF